MLALEVPVAQLKLRRRNGFSGPLVVSVLALLVLSGCSSLPKLSWPFGKKSTPPPQPVVELSFEAAAYPQYWKRNTLVLDLQSAPSSGSSTFSPATPAGWPVRLALRVRPGAFAALEVQGDARSVLPVSAAATGPIDLELDPAIYQRTTPSITVRWGAIAATP